MRRALAAMFLVLPASVGVTDPRIARAQEASSPAAQDGPTDEALLTRGIELRKEGRDAEALAAFERAYALRASSRAIAQIALAHQALGHWLDAERGLIQALRDSGDPWIARQRTHLEEGLATVQAHLAWLDVESNVAGAEVWIGRELRGHLPLDQPIRVVAGEVTVEVRAPGYATAEHTLRTDPSSRVHAVFTLIGLSASSFPGKEGPGPARVPVDARPSNARTAGRVALAGAGALLLTGSAALVTREWEAEIYDGAGCAPTHTQSRYDRCPTNRDVGAAAQTIAIVAFAGLGVALAAGGVLLLGNSSPAPARTGHLRCRFTGAAFDCGATF